MTVMYDVFNKRVYYYYDGISVALIIIIILNKETASLLIIEIAKQKTFLRQIWHLETDYFHGLVSLNVSP